MWTSWGRSPVMTTVVIGTGASIVTPTADLINGRPADATRLQWLNSVTGVGDFVEIQQTWASGAIVPGLVGMYGLNLLGLASSAGLKFSFTGQRVTDGATFPYALGGNTALVRSVTNGDGSTRALGVCALGLTAIRGVSMKIYNDQNGAANILASQFIDLGDFWAGLALDIDIDSDWKLSFPPNVPQAQSLNFQPWPVPYPSARRLQVQRTNLSFNEAFIDGAVLSYQTLRSLLGNGQPSIQIPRWCLENGTLDAPSIHATAVMGMSTFGEMNRQAGEYFSVSWAHDEIPALVA